jgi:sulfite exporter TauE/SafE
MQISSKISITAYISTYYALAFGLPMTLANYFLVGWYATWLDKFYIDSWKILVALLVVFSGSVSLSA